MKAYTGSATPTITSGSVYSQGKVMIRWTTVDNIGGYEVLCSLTETGKYEFACDIRGEYGGVIISDIPNGTLYYKVRAYNICDGKKVYSSLSNSVRITM